MTPSEIRQYFREMAGRDQVGPVCSFAGYSTVSKRVLIFAMRAGRLEIFPILALMARSTWRKR